ncbi:superoxide dismutase, Fe-Mn family [Ceratobasidium sp. AG-Ba]|nr:superoxide dismutase, Fe-Mn family [Ceratobasidium sp. AG-Ba]QRW05556.1 superoxide dismutase, Fe-Mn family [Ceratobasidium sp. AG-Ba]
MSCYKKPPSGKSSHEDEISAALQQRIINDFGTLGHLKSTMSAAALGMSSSGWVWCVQDAYGTLGIVPTFGHGTILVRNRLHHSPFYSPVVGEDPDPRGRPAQSQPPPPAASPASGTSAPRSGDTGSNKTRMPPSRSLLTENPAYSSGNLLNSISAFQNFTKIGSVLNPIFCISVHEHAWVSSGYGVWGKEEYLKRFWSVLDWKKVSENNEHWNRADSG